MISLLTSLKYSAKIVAKSGIVVLFCAGSVIAEPACSRVDAYWQTNFNKLVENLNECDSNRWHKCSQAAAIHYDLHSGSLAQRAEACGLSKPQIPGSSYINPTEADSQQCLKARDVLRDVFENRALARLSCAAARQGGIDQEWLDAQCALHRSQMANYHAPFRSMAKHCRLNYSEIVALR